MTNSVLLGKTNLRTITRGVCDTTKFPATVSDGKLYLAANR